MSRSSKGPCPCHSGKRYGECCAPFHAGDQVPPTPEALMRSRYAAFALGLGEYLYQTLAITHPDRALPRAELVASLSTSAHVQKFAGLRILRTSVDGERGEVVFAARIYLRGADASFSEASQFVKENGAWRYASGVIEPSE